MSARLQARRFIREAILQRRAANRYVPWVGPLTVDLHAAMRRRGLDLKVLVDGEDVTGRCYFADDRAGVARLFKHNDQGKPYVELHDVAREERRGDVRFVVKHGEAA